MNSRKKIRYVGSGMELGETHVEQREMMYRLWETRDDDDLMRLGLRRTGEEAT